jgi:disulfide bond formation protein DsbB
VWLQSLPADQIPACLPGLDALLHYFPWQDILHALFWGSGDCAEINWQWLGLSMPVWSLLYFLAVFCAFIFLFLLVNKQNLFAKASSS